MKVHQIISNVFAKNKKDKQKTQQQNLVSFGVQEFNQKEVMSKKASQALLSNSIASISFKGREVIDRRINVGTSGIYISSSWISSNPDESLHRTYKSIWKDSYNDAHLDIYYADEGEFITDEMKGKYHYIVTKNEPFLNLEHLKGNYRNGYQNFANEAVREVEYFEKLEKNAKKSLGVSKYFVDENRRNFEIAKEEKERIEKAKKYHVWEEGKFDKQSEEADYYYDLNRRRLEESESKKAAYEAQIQRAKERLPKAAAKYKLLKELDDKSGEKEIYLRKNRDNNQEILRTNYQLKVTKSRIESYNAEKYIINAQITHAKINIKNLEETEQHKYDNLYEINKFRDSIEENKKKLKEKDNTIAYLQTEKIKLETYMQKLKKNQAEINKDFERINPQLDAIMAKIEAFYKENYPDYLW